MTDDFFEGRKYNDDRMFVLYLCRGTVRPGEHGTTVTTIYHEANPPDAKWCLVTYRNTERYPATRVDHFDSLEAARAYLQRVEPTVPCISLNGHSPENPMSYEAFLDWKRTNGLREYDYRTMYVLGGENPCEETFFSASGSDGCQSPGSPG